MAKVEEKTKKGKFKSEFIIILIIIVCVIILIFSGNITKTSESEVATSYEKTVENEIIKTGLKKFGAMLGDYVEVGCNSVLCPGTIVGENTNIYPLTRVRGIIKNKMIVKDMNNIIEKEER